MFGTIIEFSRYFVILLFGAGIAVSLAGMAPTQKNRLVFWCYIITVYILQIICLYFWGMDKSLKMYPVICHLPIIVFIIVYLKRSLLISLTSLFVSYQCCQLPRFFGTVAGAISGSVSMNHAVYVLAAFPLYCFLKKYVIEPARHLMERSAKSCLLFGAMPAFYYIFEHATTVYTGFLYSGTRPAVQFTPFLAATFYFAFVLLYCAETQKQALIQRERDMLDSQLKQAQTEFASLVQMQQNAAAYRHDMRHHFTLLQGLALNENIEEIKEYLRTAQADIDAITPVRFCENETINLILSSYAARAKQSEVLLEVDAKLPEELPFSDTELCSLLSNALENAINASKKIPDINKRIIRLRLYEKNNKLCMDIRNSYHIEPAFHQGVPVSDEPGHGYGTRSMVHTIEKYGGVYQFSIRDGWFIFQTTAG